MNTLLPVTNDFVFKKLFGEPDSEDILQSLLEAILNITIQDLQIQKDKELFRSYLNDKLGIIDIKAMINNSTKLNIEIQIKNQYNMDKRSYFYLSKLYIEDFQKGEQYQDLPKVISINFLDYNEHNSNNCHSVFRLKDQNNNDFFYLNTCEIHFIELNKIDYGQVKPELLDWLQFIKNAHKGVEAMLFHHNKYIRKAAEKFIQLNANSSFKALAESRAKYLSDLNSNLRGAKEEGIERGIEKGIKKGIEKGIEKGIDLGTYNTYVNNIKTFLKFNNIEENLHKEIQDYLESKPKNNDLIKLIEALFRYDETQIKQIIS